MATCHNISLGADLFSQTSERDHIILQLDGVKAGDFILFKKVDPVTEADSGLYLMTQVIHVYSHEGLKEGYVLVSYKKLA